MYLVVILGFALVLVVEHMRFKSVFALDPAGSIATVAGLTAATLIGCEVCVRLVLRRVRLAGRSMSNVGRFHLRCQTGIRYAIVLSFGAMLFVFNWSGTVRNPVHPRGDITPGWGLADLPLVDDLVLLVPFLLSTVLSWAIVYRADRALRSWGARQEGTGADGDRGDWSLSHYMVFQIRHHLLFLAIPMSLIILANDLGTRYHRFFAEKTGQLWMGQALVGVAAGFVFLLMPWMMRYIWTTKPLPAGQLRTRLEALASRVGLRYRQILLWESDGAVVNAAVTGLLAPFRYVLLSDGLLESMDDTKVEAVFGHEVGHVKEHHILYYLGFTMCALVAGIATGNAVESYWTARDLPWLGDTTELVTLVVLWAWVFGSISRRFERHADVFGVRCVSRPEASDNESAPAAADAEPAAPATRLPRNGPITAEAADTFGQALYRVAVLNGMSPSARSWRHSSIASRVAFLGELARDPDKLAAFDRMIRRIKMGLWLWGLASGAYWLYAFRQFLTFLPWDWVGLG